MGISNNTLILQLETDIDINIESIDKASTAKDTFWRSDDLDFLQHWENYNSIRSKLIKLDNRIFKDLKELTVPKTKDINFVTKGLYFPKDLYPLSRELKKAKEYLKFVRTRDKEEIAVPDNIFKYSWNDIKIEFDITKISFGKKINFITNKDIREIIFRDVEQAYTLAKNGFSKPAVLLAGSVIEELLRQYLQYKNPNSNARTFEKYIEGCKENEILKKPMSQYSDSIRQFRNLVHIKEEKKRKITLSKDIAIGAVTIIFTIVNSFE